MRAVAVDVLLLLQGFPGGCVHVACMAEAGSHTEVDPCKPLRACTSLLGL